MTLRLSLFSALAAGLLAAQPAAAQQRVVPPSPEALRMSYAPIVQRVTPAVVTVSAAKTVENRNPLMDDPFFRRFFGGGGGPFGGGRQEQRSLGSGVIVEADGLIVTNNHVIDGADQVKVSLADKREFEVDVVLKDARTDLAVLRVKDGKERFPVLEFSNSDELQVGDVVLAVGNPFGVGQTVTHGIVSGVARTQVGISDYQFFIQTDASINPGNSGGPLVDMAGRMVGLNTAIFSRSGGSVGVGFAIPANMVRVVVASARTGATVKRPWLGANLQAVTPELSREFDLKRPAGAVVTNVTANSPAARAGLKPGDVITAVGDQPVDDPNAFNYRFVTHSLGGTVPLGIVRGGRETKLALALETAPESPRDELVIKARSPFTGATVANLSPALADELRLESSTEGVAVTEVGEGTLAQNFGFQRGDVVLSVNNTKIAKTRDLEKVAQAGARLWRIVIQRGGQQISAVFGG